jgi:tetratricopeptide (TPR) repeat protein/regulator of replication initiation timing
MLDRPDSAYDLVSAIDSQAITSRSDKMLYYLLLTQATDRIGIEEYDDTYISQAAKYYATKSDERHKMLSYYYYGLINFYNSDYPQSMNNLLYAETSAKQINDKFYLGMIYRSMCDIYTQILDGPLQLKYAFLSYYNFKAANAKSHAAYAMIDLGRAYFNTDSIRKSIEILDSCQSIAKAIGDQHLLTNAILMLGSAYSYIEDYPSAKSAFEKVVANDPIAMRSSDYSMLGVSYIRCGLIDSAKQILNKIDNIDPSNNWFKHELYYRTGDYDSVYKYMMADIVYRDNKIDELSKLNVSSNVSSYYELELKDKDIKIAQSHLSLTIFIALAVIAIIIATYIYKINLTKKRQLVSFYMNTAQDYKENLDSISAQLKNRKLTIDGLKNDINNKEYEIQALRVILESKSSINSTLSDTIAQQSNELTSAKQSIVMLITEKFEAINEICDVYYSSSSNTDLDKTLVYRKVSTIINSLKKRTSDISYYERLINKCLSGIAQKLKTVIPNISSLDYALFIYLAMGFSPKAISILCSCSIEATYRLCMYIMLIDR